MVVGKFTDQLRRIIDASGRSRYAICKGIGIDQATMSRFMGGTGGLSMEALDRLAAYLDLEIVARPEAPETED